MEFHFAKALLLSSVAQLLVNYGYGQRPYNIAVDGPKFVRLQPGDPLTIKCNYTKRRWDLVEWMAYEPCSDWETILFSGSQRFEPYMSYLRNLNMTLIPDDEDSQRTSGNGTTALSIESYYIRNLSCQPIQIGCMVGEDSVNIVKDKVTIEMQEDITARHGTSVKRDTCFGSQMLKCAAEIASVPAATYSWSIPDDVDMLEFSSSFDGPVFVVPKGRSGLFNCTATNTLTLNSVQITFVVVTCEKLTSDSVWMWTTTAAVLAASIITILAAVFLYKRGPPSEITLGFCYVSIQEKVLRQGSNQGQLQCNETC